MRMFIPLLIISIVSVISLYALRMALIEYAARKKGKRSPATVISVDRTIPVGFRRFGGKDGSYSCDYLLTLSYRDRKGKEHVSHVTARSRLKILGGKRFLHFASGDKVSVRFLDRFPTVVVFDAENLARNQGALFFVLLWALTSLIALSILAYLAFFA